MLASVIWKYFQPVGSRKPATVSQGLFRFDRCHTFFNAIPDQSYVDYQSTDFRAIGSIKLFMGKICKLYFQDILDFNGFSILSLNKPFSTRLL